MVEEPAQSLRGRVPPGLIKFGRGKWNAHNPYPPSVEECEAG